jgi:hypothetical protein
MKILSVAEIGIFLWLLIGDIKKIKKIVYENKKTEFEDFKINIKILLAGLWTSVMFLYIYGDYFELYVPKKVEGLLNGSNLLDTPYKLLFATILLAVPSLMIFLSLMLKPKINRI